MTNVRKLMGRLNPATAQYNMGRGGIPELTPQDIAGAIGMIGDELAREVFCAVWWPDGARLTRDYLLRLIGLRQRAEIDRQWRAVQIIRLDLHIASDDLACRRAVTSADQLAVRRIEDRLRQVKADCWPCVPQMYSIVRNACLEELREPHLCKVCDGRGEAVADGLTINCKQCDGNGLALVSDRQRAARIGRDESNYRREWKPVYEWTHDLLSTAERVAATGIEKALGRQVA